MLAGLASTGFAGSPPVPDLDAGDVESQDDRVMRYLLDGQRVSDGMRPLGESQIRRDGRMIPR
jgi:hypothetical protein